MILHQATAVAINGRGMLIEGPPGSGKSSLALALIDRGAGLIGDDGLALSVDGKGTLLAAPAPATLGLLEVRNVGLVQVAASGPTPVDLVIVLDPNAPRFIQQAEETLRAGCALPLVRLWPDSPVLALRAEKALEIFGSPALSGPASLGK